MSSLALAPAPHVCETALLVATRGDGRLIHGCFEDIGDHLDEGDLLVVNDSQTIPAAVPARLDDGRRATLNLSTPTEDGHWLVELRTADRFPFGPPPPGARVELPGGARATLLGPFETSRRLAVAELQGVDHAYLARHGSPIRYRHDAGERPIADYQTVFARRPGSAEMPSAARPFTTELVTQLVARGVLIAPITLHAGVSSLEGGERPYPERYAVPQATARLVNAVRAWGGRVIAVGTTVVRALETTTGADSGTVHPAAGYTELVITPERGLWAVDGLITGWHEPESSHLQLLEAAAGADLLRASYSAASERGYRWHEFGDSHLILP